MLGDVSPLGVLVDSNCSAVQSLFGIDQMRQDLPLHVDQLQRLLGGQLVHRGNGGDLVADETRLVRGERLFIPRPGNHPVASGHLLSLQHLDHSGVRATPSEINLFDPRVCVRAAKDLAVEHSRKPDIVGVNCLPGGLLEAIGFPQSPTDHMIFFFAAHGSPWKVVGRGSHSATFR